MPTLTKEKKKSRSRFFKDLMCGLKNIHSFYEMVEFAKKHQGDIDSYVIQSDADGHPSLANKSPTDYDPISICVLQEVEMKGWLLLLIYGDGNCLFRAASLFICGHEEKMVDELRVRVTVEHLLHKYRYLQLPNVPLYCKLSDYYPHGNENFVLNEAETDNIYQLEVLDVARDGSYLLTFYSKS